MNNKLVLKGQIKCNSMHDETHFIFVACRFDSEKENWAKDEFNETVNVEKLSEPSFSILTNCI